MNVEDFFLYTLADIFGIVVSLILYDWIIDPWIEKIENKHQHKNVLEKQDIS